MTTTAAHQKSLTDHTVYEDIKIIRLEKYKDEKDLGFQVTWSIATGVCVSSIKPGGAAARNGIVSVGDQLLWIEKENVRYSTSKDVEEILNNSDVIVRMVVSKIKQQGQHTGHHSKSTINKSLQPPVQLLPSISPTDEPYTFAVNYLPPLTNQER